MKKLTISLLLALMVMTTAQIALGQGKITGSIEASANEGPMNQALAYALNITQDTGIVAPGSIQELSSDPGVPDDDDSLLKIERFDTPPKVCSGNLICETFRLAKLNF